MKYLTLELCKKQSYVEHDEDDSLIEQYANAAEEVVENYLECPLSDLENEAGELPAAIIQGMLLYIASLYANREGFSTMKPQATPQLISTLKPYRTYGIKRG